MAYVNVAEWKTNQVCEWLKGLDNSILPYVHSFMNHNVNGQQLLNLRPEDLEHLGVFKLGHQEIILETVEYLRNFHYELDRENLQLLAMRLSCQTHSLYNELSRQTDSKPVTTQTLSDVVAIITVVKPLVRWLDQPPFSGQLDYNDKKTELLKLSLEMATCAQRDRFAEKPIEEIRTTCGHMAKLADYIIQDIVDPMILQPSSLDLATLKKRPGDDVGFCILPSFHGAHQIAEIKFGSVAHQCGKMEEGDEIVQINYQTVVGWERKSVLELFRESPAEILLTLKRRPRHIKVYGQIYIKPYRLPSNKKTPYATRWQNNLPSPRPELLTIPDFTMPLPRHIPKVPTPEPVSILDTVSILDAITTDDSTDSDSEIEIPSSARLYSAKRTNFVKRRATITGASPITEHGVDIEQFWKELKQERNTTFLLREKATSCTHSLDSVQEIPNVRSQTCLSIEQRVGKKGTVIINDSRKVQFQEDLSRDKLMCDNLQEQCISTNESNCNLILYEAFYSGTETNNQKSDNTGSLKGIHYQDNCFSFTNDNKKCIINSVRKSENKDYGKLNKCLSTPMYDLIESDDDLVEIKLEDTFDKHYKQQIIKTNSTIDNNSNSLKKTEFHLFYSANDLEKYEKEQMSNYTIHDCKLSVNKSKILGNVAQKIIDIEKNIHDKSKENNLEKISSKLSSVCDVMETSIHIKSNDINISDNLNECKVDSCNITTNFDTDEESNFLGNSSIEMKCTSVPIIFVESVIDNLIGTKNESNKGKFESTNSYIENGIRRYSSNGNITIKKFNDIMKTINNVLEEQTRLNANESKDKKNESNNIKLFTDKISKKYNLQNTNNQNDKLIDAFSPNVQIHKNAIVENISIKYATTSVSNNITHNDHSETSNKNITKSDIKPRLTPPEPPPRKYFMNLTNFNGNQQQIININTQDHYPQQQHKPKIPERSNIQRDIKHVAREGFSKDEKNLSEYRRKGDHLETADFVEKPIDIIQTLTEPITNLQELKTPTSLIDPYGFTQTPEINLREVNLQSQDSTDCLYQSYNLQSDNKSRTLDKDRSHEKGMVNRAMMVARSMGLHSTLTKSNSSPKSARKRNTILVKRRNVAVKDISPGDLEGWLTYRSRGAGGAWTRAWFIMKDASLYRFKTQGSTKADCLIALSGFTASQATEVKSRKNAFKVYYTGTVFYFAADTEDTLTMWLEAINKATLRAECINALLSETDESDGESRTKMKNSLKESKPLTEKTFGSLKKFGKKDFTIKNHEISGASLDRKYLKFLGTRTQNVPVPTAQFRSYRRVLPTSIPNRKSEKTTSPDLQVTIAGSTFYGLNTSHNVTNVLDSSHDMGDYRRTTDRSRSSRNHQRLDELHGLITLEEFMLSRQEEECLRTNSYNKNNVIRFTPLNNDHVHLQHQNITDSSPIDNIIQNNGMIYGSPKNGDDILRQASPSPNLTHSEFYSSNHSFNSDANSDHRNNEITKIKIHKKSWEPSCLQIQKSSVNNNYDEHNVYLPNLSNRNFTRNQMNAANDSHIGYLTLDYGERLKPQLWLRTIENNTTNTDLQHTSKRISRNDGYLDSNNDLTCHKCSETIEHTKKKVTIARNGSFNITDRRRRDQIYPECNWIESLHSTDKKSFNIDKERQKYIAQNQSPPISMFPFKQESMKTSYEIHLDKEMEQKKSTKGLRNLFGNKSPQKQNSLDFPHEPQKKLLGSPRLHRALFRDKSYQRQNNNSGNKIFKDTGINQNLNSYSGVNRCHTFNQNFDLVNSAHWSTDIQSHPSKCMISGVMLCQKRLNIRHPVSPPKFPYIPPPTSPPPDYPGLEYPPVFEPGTYSLSDASLLQYRSTKNQNLKN